MTLTAYDHRTPERSLDQRRAALRQANAIRVRRSQFKRDLKSGEVSLVVALLDTPDWLMTAKVFDVLRALPRCGQVKANRTLIRLRISPSKTVGGLSDRQRDALLYELLGVRTPR